MNYDATPMACRECHSGDGQGFSFFSSACPACHTDHDPEFISQHRQDFGENCLACHDGKDRMASFDHSTLTFRLEEKHALVRCVQCHTHERQSQQPDRPFQNTPVECVGCHAEPAIHRAMFEPACGDCHTPDGWTPATLNGASFTHEKGTSFSLARHAQDYAGQPITCSGCHPSGIQAFTSQACVDCHSEHAASFMKQHTQKYGPSCLACHDGKDRMHAFDHAKVFPLEGRHAKIGCQDCHAAQKFRGTPTACSGCHAEPAYHAGLFGSNCVACHSTAAWVPAKFNGTHSFPLGHGGAKNCRACHPSSLGAYTCYGCHPAAQIENKHREEGITNFANCVRCHPTGQGGGD